MRGRWHDATPQAGATGPTMVGDVRLDVPLAARAAGPGYCWARLLVWLHGRPVGEVEMPLTQGGLDVPDLADAIGWQLGGRLRAHLRDDGLDYPTTLAHGLPRGPGEPRCRTARSAAAGPRPPATVVVATRDRTASLIRCLDSLARQDYPGFDVVVVDSAPAGEQTLSALEQHPGWPFRLRYVRVDRPGVAVAHNAALPAVSGDVVAFADDDVEADPGWLSALAEPFDEGDTACVTGLILPAELDTRAQRLVERSGGFARGFDLRHYRLSEPPDALFPFAAGRFGSGANMAFRADWLRAHAGFDSAIGTGTAARGGDDLLAFLRVVLDGRTLVYQPAALVRHHHRRGIAGMRRQAYGYGVGLGAYLTAAVWAQPSLLPAMLRRGGAAARHFLASDSEKNRGKGRDYPASLTWRERAGLAAGPGAYARSRWRAHRWPDPIAATVRSLP